MKQMQLVNIFYKQNSNIFSRDSDIFYKQNSNKFSRDSDKIS